MRLAAQIFRSLHERSASVIELLIAYYNAKRSIQMTPRKKLVLPMVAGILMLGGLAACEREGPMERAGEKIDETAENVGDKVEKATD